MKKDYTALLTVTEFPQTIRGKEQLANWLYKKGDEILESNSDEYSKQVRFRLMKPIARVRK